MRGLVALWRELGAEIDTEFGTSLKDRVQDMLLGVGTLLVLAIDAVLLIAGVLP